MKTTSEIYARADAFVRRMTLEEKLSQIIETAPAVERLGIPKYYHGNEALHGVVRPGRFTVFPQAIALGAMFDTRRQAEAMAATLTDIPAGVVPLRAEAVRMRITAPDRQIDLIVAADGMLRDGAWQLSTLARQLDRGEIQPEAAMKLCALSGSEADGLRKKLQAIPGAEDNRLCAALMDALKGMSEALSEVRSSGKTGAALSGLIRLAGIDTFITLMDLQASLTQ